MGLSKIWVVVSLRAMALMEIADRLTVAATGESRAGTITRLPGAEQRFRNGYFDREVIVSCERWRVRFKLSFWDLTEMMAERGLSVATPRSCARCIIMIPSLGVAGTCGRGRWIHPDVSTRSA